MILRVTAIEGLNISLSAALKEFGWAIRDIGMLGNKRVQEAVPPAGNTIALNYVCGGFSLSKPSEEYQWVRRDRRYSRSINICKIREKGGDRIFTWCGKVFSKDGAMMYIHKF